MDFLQIFTIVASSATIFAFIVGIFSVYNGRMTRKEISRLIKETSESSQNLMVKEFEETRKILQGIIEILNRINGKVS